MRTRTTAILAIAMLSLAACGNDQGDVADEMIKQAADAGMDLDEQCVRDLSVGLTDEDVRSLEEGSDGPTPAAQDVLTKMVIDCASTDDIIETILAELPDDGTVDKECVAELLKDTDLSAAPDDAAASAMLECMSIES
jgi:hypothetical protein